MRRRSRPKNLTCAKKSSHLRQGDVRNSVDIIHRIPDRDEFLEGEGAVDGEEEVGAEGGCAPIDFSVRQVGDDVAAEYGPSLVQISVPHGPKDVGEEVGPALIDLLILDIQDDIGQESRVAPVNDILVNPQQDVGDKG